MPLLAKNRGQSYVRRRHPFMGGKTVTRRLFPFLSGQERPRFPRIKCKAIDREARETVSSEHLLHAADLSAGTFLFVSQNRFPRSASVIRIFEYQRSSDP